VQRPRDARVGKALLLGFFRPLGSVFFQPRISVRGVSGPFIINSVRTRSRPKTGTCPLAICSCLWYTEGMSTANTGNTRAGKYCPRCQAMTVLAQDICAQCGHRFRSGHPEMPGHAPRTDADTLNRTRQFTLPPLQPRLTPAVGIEQTASPQRRPGLFFAAALLLFITLVITLAAVHSLRQTGAERAAKPSPAGIWETTLSSRSSQNAHLKFVFGQDGSGWFSWTAGTRPVRQGQAPLHWRLDGARQLVLTIAPSPHTGTVARTLITIFGSHPWLWHTNLAQHRLVLGTVVFESRTRP
jgi:hypothetical protein